MKKQVVLFISFFLTLTVLSGKEIYGKPWVNTNIAGNLPDNAGRLEDDFNLYTTYDWCKTTKISSNRTSASSFVDVAELRKKEIISILEGSNPTSHEEQISQTLYKQALDWKQRNKAGVKPAIPDLKRLQDTKNLEELKTLLSEKFSPYTSVVGIEYKNTDFADSNVYLPLVAEINMLLPDADWYTTTLSDDAKKRLEFSKNYFTKILAKFGYSKTEANAIIDNVFAFEMKYCPKAYGTTAKSQLDFYSKIYNIYSKADYEKEFPNLPIAKSIENNGAGFITRLMVINPECHKLINDLFVEENFEALKNWTILAYVSDCSYYLDRQCYNINQEYSNKVNGKAVKMSDKEIAYELADTLGMAIGKVWVEKFFKPEIKEDVTKLTEQLINIFDTRIRNLEWMSESTKVTALEKLHSINYIIGYPEVWKDYSSLDLPVIYKDGSLYDSMQKIRVYEAEEDIKKIQKPVNKLEWGFTPQTINAFYNPTNNSINILAGILAGEIYQYDWPVEKKLGGIGLAIGHELTHGFDAHGSQFDKSGNMTNWWTTEDAEAFGALNQKVIDYYSSFEVVPGVMNNGLLCIGEIVADIGGITFCTDYGKNTNDFDYVLMFNQFSKTWRQIASYEAIKNQALFNGHPINFIRVNATLQQNQAFYDTYNIKEGDGMYLAPEKRLVIW